MKNKVSLILSGGGARGIAHIGVIEELERQGFEIHSIAGTSMGALVGGVYSLGKMNEFKQWLMTLDKVKIFSLLDFTLSNQGIVKGNKVLKKMREFIPDANIEDLDIAYAAVAADLINKKEVVFTSGSVFKAIRASIAIPTVFTPVKTKSGLLVDGGVLNNVPVSHAKRIPGDLLVVVNINANVPVCRPPIPEEEKKFRQLIYQKKLNDFYSQLERINPLNKKDNIGYFNLINKTISLMIYRMSEVLLQQYKPDITIEFSKDLCGIFDFFKVKELVETGRYTTMKRLDEFQTKIEHLI
ncbi:MAG: patatin-like phospholipase family protein [Prolixibacteraceae bacterium]